jgi:hypothetical protein
MSIREVAGCMLVLGLAAVVGCSRGPSRLNAPSIDASSAGSKAVEMYGKDGKISGADLEKCPALKSALARIDTTGDGTITAAKITARIKVWQESKLARMSLTCSVMRNGSPLVGADVKFVPEKFLGEAIPTATGKTDQSGVAMMSVPTTDRSDPPGVAPGFYRIEVTKAGENIPAKYNTASTLGEEIFSDTKAGREGVRLNLQY